MILPTRNAPFIDAVAVEAWDAWFRWRDAGELCDVSIEDTWVRVAVALAAPEAPRAVRHWQDRFLDCLADWRVLPDERLLAGAGTGCTAWPDPPLAAVVNAATCVRAPGTLRARLDLDAVVASAACAVRMLDNALIAARRTPTALRIGVIGIADALALLGRGYDTSEGRAAAAAFAAALACGCRAASRRLARERGSSLTVIPSSAYPDADCASRPRAPRRTTRHPHLTAITSQPRLALFANHVADAIDPAHGNSHTHRIAVPGGTRILRSAGYARRVLSPSRAAADDPRTDNVATLPWQAQLRMRAALQPWIDAPITYPLLLPDAAAPDRATAGEVARLATRHGLAVPEWRNVESLRAL